MENLSFQLIDILGEELQQSIFAVLRTHNFENNAQFCSARDLEENAPKALHVVAFDIDHKLVGGLIAETQFRWLRIKMIAVAEPWRGRGIARHILEMAEFESKARGCRYSYLETMEYQAPEFYHKQGYRSAGELSDWDSHGHTKYLFTKELA